jgi:hypothetical protein
MGDFLAKTPKEYLCNVEAADIFHAKVPKRVEEKIFWKKAKTVLCSSGPLVQAAISLLIAIPKSLLKY